jgi:S-formylglutathione hydrolase FrmB
MAYCILLPADYETSARSYPVLYLLHGLWGTENDWSALTHVAAYVKRLPLIVVMPEADDSWYTNSATDSANRYEDYLFKDVVQLIESSYRVQKDREGRFLAGLSMGGYGALKGAVKYPQMFAAIGAFSASLRSHQDDGRWVTTAMAFGKPGSETRRDNDVFPLLAKSDITKLPYIFESCGERDDLEPIDLQLAQMFRNLGAAYEYHELPGKHEWPVWDASLKLFLDSLVERKLLPAT